MRSFCDRFRMAWRRSSHATIDARLLELELISGNLHVRFDERGVETEPRLSHYGTARRKGGNRHAQPNVTAPHLDSTDSRHSIARDEPPPRVMPKTAECGSLIEVRSVVGAVRFAIEVQKALSDKIGTDFVGATKRNSK
jgi:hypothetical protein